jgi:hypothetical protein
MGTTIQAISSRWNFSLETFAPKFLLNQNRRDDLLRPVSVNFQKLQHAFWRLF